MNNCHQYPELIKWFNICDYSVIDFIIVGAGTLFWVLSYILIIKHGFKNKFVEMPLYVGIGNLAWEFVWSFMERTNMGEAFLWGYRAWFFLDLFIFYLLIKYSKKQFNIPLIKRNTLPIIIGLFLFFVCFFYFFAQGGYDTPIGATSAFFLSVGISTLYITLLLSNKNVKNFSLWSGIFRALGDAILTIFAIKYTGNALITIMGIYVVLLDFTYVILLWKMKYRPKQSENFINHKVQITTKNSLNA